MHIPTKTTRVKSHELMRIMHERSCNCKYESFLVLSILMINNSHSYHLLDLHLFRFTIGVFKLHDDGTPVIDSESGNPVDAYTNDGKQHHYSQIIIS